MQGSCGDMTLIAPLDSQDRMPYSLTASRLVCRIAGTDEARQKNKWHGLAGNVPPTPQKVSAQRILPVPALGVLLRVPNDLSSRLTAICS